MADDDVDLSGLLPVLIIMGIIYFIATMSPSRMLLKGMLGPFSGLAFGGGLFGGGGGLFG